MPTYQQITSAREKAKRIREYAVSFRRKRAQLEELLDRIVQLKSKARVKKDTLRVYGRMA